MIFPKKLEGENIILENFSEKHLHNDYVEWLRDEEINRFLVTADKNITIEDLRKSRFEYINSDKDYFLAIIEKNDNKHIGNVHLGPVDKTSKKCQFGMMIGDKKYHGRGLAKEAVALCIDYCFKELKMHKLFLNVDEENIPAIKVYEKNNFHTEGVLKDHVFFKGKFHDLRMMARFNDKV